jgi:hypothetical protein
LIRLALVARVSAKPAVGAELENLIWIVALFNILCKEMVLRGGRIWPVYPQPALRWRFVSNYWRSQSRYREEY